MNALRRGPCIDQQSVVPSAGDCRVALRCRLWLRRRLWKLAARRRALRLLRLSPLFTEVEHRWNF